MRLPSATLVLSFALALVSGAQAQTPPVCTGLCLQQVKCTGAATTTLSGTVFAPNGLDPLPNVLVYIPNAPVDAFAPGVSCPVVGTPPPGSPLVGTTTAVNGTFTISNVPVGTGIPLIIQTGRWRRQFTIDITNSCADNPTIGIRMPRNHTEGDIPKIAIATGSADSVECVLRKVGIDDAEFTDITGAGRINLFPGSGSPGTRTAPSTADQATLMNNASILNSYDVLMLPCEGGTHPDVKNTTEYANLVAFADAGGRIYASHYSYQWMINNAPFDSVAAWNNSGAAVGGTETNLLSSTVVTNFSEGNILAQWLQLVGASTVPGKIGLQYVKRDINGVNAPTQPYLTLDSNGAVMQFVWDTPVKAKTNQCGRVLFNEYHVENPTSPYTSAGTTFPAECSPVSMTPQEKLLEFSLFELTADGSAATLTPATADFGTEPINFTTPSQQFTWTNNSTFGSAVTLLTATGDFLVQGSNCSAVPAGGSCTINVAFRPTATGARTGTLTVGSTGSTLLSSLTGNGIPDLVFNFTAFDFGSIDVGATLSKTITVTNSANGPVTVPALLTTGDYSATNSCGSQVAAQGTCFITVTFKPTTNDVRTGTLAVASTDPAYTGTPTTLTGNGLDFTIGMKPDTGTVIAGYSITTTDITTPLSGFTAPLTVTCTVSAPGSTCSVSNVPGVGIATTSLVNITTTSQYTVIGYGGFGATGWLWLVGLASGAFLLLGRRRIGSTLRTTLMLVFIAAAGLSLTGCSGKLPAVNAGYTVPGPYTYVITATDGFLVHSTRYTLNVTQK